MGKNIVAIWWPVSIKDQSARTAASFVYPLSTLPAPEIYRKDPAGAPVTPRPGGACGRIVQKKNRHSSGCDPMVVAEHSAEALSALNRVMG
jgi:hypothetical protein